MTLGICLWTNVLFAQWQGTAPIYYTSGNVGIGTSSPGGKLDINWAGGQLRLSGGTVPAGVWTSTTDLLYLGDWQTGTKGLLINLTSGNVGIGSSSPLSKLHINSSIERETFRIYKQGNTANYLSLWQGTGGGVIDPIGTGLLHLGYDQSTNVIMGYTGAGVNSGNVGIGTPNPDAKLAVKGQIHAQEVKVDLNGAVAPDYVFASNYQLPTLDYIKTYIDQYKHLPEVPSAKEMETNGVNLGEMNMLLLKKIEELTLHLISQEKRIKELEKNNK